MLRELNSVQHHPVSFTMSQRHLTSWPHVCNMLNSLIVNVREWKCCISLFGPNIHRPQIVYKGKFLCGSNYIGETTRNFEVTSKLKNWTQILVRRLRTRLPATLANPSYFQERSSIFSRAKDCQGLVTQQKESLLKQTIQLLHRKTDSTRNANSFVFLQQIMFWGNTTRANGITS